MKSGASAMTPHTSEISWKKEQGTYTLIPNDMLERLIDLTVKFLDGERKRGENLRIHQGKT